MIARAKRTIQSMVAAGLFITALAPAVAREREESSSSARLSTASVAGLKAPGKIIVDVWGIPHIYAGNESDLFFLQGFNAARDGLWQLDLWRNRGQGLSARGFGGD